MSSPPERPRRPAMLVLQHEDGSPPALLGEWAAERGWAMRVVRLDHDEAVPAVEAWDVVVTLGADDAAYDDDVPWQATEQATLRAAADASVPTFGICFGGQSLSRALGGGARPAAVPEAGWIELDVAGPAAAGDVWRGPWLSWHGDEILPPPGAEVLARSQSCVHAWKLGPHVGIQFHPEVTEAVVRHWIETDARMTGCLSTSLEQESARELPANRARAYALFDAVLSRAAPDATAVSRSPTRS